MMLSILFLSHDGFSQETEHLSALCQRVMFTRVAKFFAHFIFSPELIKSNYYYIWTDRHSDILLCYVLQKATIVNVTILSYTLLISLLDISVTSAAGHKVGFLLLRKNSNNEEHFLLRLSCSLYEVSMESFNEQQLLTNTH